VQGAHRGVGIPGALCAVTGKAVGQCGGVFGEVFKRDGAVFDE